MVAEVHADAISKMADTTLAGVYARSPEKGLDFVGKFGGQYYPELDQLLASDDIDIVTIATPSGLHLEPVLKAAKAGKHIICEKPLEVDIQRIEEMIKVCRENGVVLAGIFNRRFNPAVEILAKAVKENRFGTLSICDAQVKWYRDQAYYDSGAWRGTWELDGGGALMNQSIHTIDLLIYLAGDIKRVSAKTACLTHSGIEVEDNAVAIVEFKNGAIGTITGSTSCWSSTGLPAEVQISGSEGSVILTDDQFRVWDFKNQTSDDEIVKKELMLDSKGGAGANDPRAINSLGHQRNFEDLIEAIENGRDPLVTGEEAMRSVKLINAIYKSTSNDGKWIEL